MNANRVQTAVNEQWLKVNFDQPTKNCEYYISNFGRIKSVDKFTDFERLLKGSIVNRGFKVLSIILVDGSHGYVYVHKFVGENFVKKAAADCTILVHKDYTKSNNKWSNLEWIKEMDWRDYLSAKPGYNPTKFINRKNYKLNETKVKMIKKMLSSGKVKRAIIARNFGVSENQIYQIQIGRRWGHVKLELDN